MVWAAIALVVYATIGFYFWLRYQESKTTPIDYVQLNGIVERLHENEQKLMCIEDLLTTAQVCGEEDTQIKCTWDSGSGKKEYSFELNGVSENFSDMAEEEREKLREAIAADVDLICKLRRYGIMRTVTQTSEAEPEYQQGSGDTQTGESENDVLFALYDKKIKEIEGDSFV